MRPFYEEQLQRMSSSQCEPILFEDVICQLHDLIQPEIEGYFSIHVFCVMLLVLVLFIDKV